MSRKEVIKLLKLIKSTVYLGNRKFLDALEYAISYLNQPEQQWIPCSERLPDKTDDYLCSYDGCAVVDICEYDTKRKKSGDSFMMAVGR